MADYGAGAARASQAYRMTADAGLSPADAAIALHERLCRELFAAKLAYEQKALDRMCLHTTRCTHVLLELRSGVKVEGGDDGARALEQLYLHLFWGVARVLRAKEPAKRLQYIIDILWKLSREMRTFQINRQKSIS